MSKTIIARLKKRDGFIKEIAISKIRTIIEIAEFPPMQSYPYVDEELNNHKIKKSFFQAEAETIYIDYKEI